MLNFFASWCASCVAELPDFETVSQSFDGEVTFLGLAVQDRRDTAIQLIERTGVTFPTGLDQNGRIFAQFEGFSMPTTVFIHADGTVSSVHSGPLNAETLAQKIHEDLLAIQ